MKLIMVDLDGTLFDTKDVNYLSYQEAMKPYGYFLDYDYYCEYCNGRYYLDFLPGITKNEAKLLDNIHEAKKKSYGKYIGHAKPNLHLIEILRRCRGEYKIALVTTASRENTYQLLDEFGLTDDFDLILTRDDITHSKPNPEGFLKAMDLFGVHPSEALIFEDSEVGLQAARASGASVMVVEGFN